MDKNCIRCIFQHKHLQKRQKYKKPHSIEEHGFAENLPDSEQFVVGYD